MKQNLILTALLFFVFGWCAVSIAQEMDTYESKDFNIKFKVPAQWHTLVKSDKDVPYLESISPDEATYLFVYSYKDSKISTEELLDQQVTMLEMSLKGTKQEEEINGLHAWVAEATGKIQRMDVGMFIMAATYNENNYVAYIFTDESKFDVNSKMMNAILDSFEPLIK